VHELSLAAGIVRIVEETRERDPFERVTHLHLEAGALCGVEVSALRFSLEAMAAGTCLAGAVIEIDEPPAMAWCMPCGQSVPIRSRLELCPLCQGAQLQPIGGTALRVVELLVV
jgi:hydrogenase nickel incorporation protein HypA/HybF